MKLIGDKLNFGIEYRINTKRDWYNTSFRIWCKNQYIGDGEIIEWPLSYIIDPLQSLTSISINSFKKDIEVSPNNYEKFSDSAYVKNREQYMYFNSGGFDDWEIYNFTINNQLFFLWRTFKDNQFYDKNYGDKFKFEQLSFDLYKKTVNDFFIAIKSEVPEFTINSRST